MENLKKIEQLERLNNYIKENFNMELMDTDVSEIVLVKNEVTGWEKCLTSKEYEGKNGEDYRHIVQELKKFFEYDCLYCLDSENGGFYGQGYVIIDKDLNFIDFVRTI